jgi:hypothetical protein
MPHVEIIKFFQNHWYLMYIVQYLVSIADDPTELVTLLVDEQLALDTLEALPTEKAQCLIITRSQGDAEGAFSSLHFFKYAKKCCGLGMFIPDPKFFHPGSRIRIFFIPDPGSASKN